MEKEIQRVGGLCQTQGKRNKGQEHKKSQGNRKLGNPRQSRESTSLKNK